jgi:hypothetical protein
MFWKKKINISSLLRGTSAGELQSVGCMQIIPLISDIEDHRFISPQESEFSTSDYGTMVFNNTTESILLIPCHVGYAIKNNAQDHAMSHLGVVKAKTSKSYKTAMCIQASQGGYFSKGSYKMIILPFALREKALAIRKKINYDKLWDDISQFNGMFGLKQNGHLEYFLDHFQKELDQFTSKFEWVPKQIGAIILINGEVVGIERTPSCQYWQSVRHPLIRECYGSLAIQTSKIDKRVPNTRVSLSSDVQSLDELSELLNNSKIEERQRSKKIINDLLNNTLKQIKEKTVKGLTIETIYNKQFTGQIVRDSEQIVYASCITKKVWYKNKEWLKAKPFTM